jgi:hypothetical protein
MMQLNLGFLCGYIFSYRQEFYDWYYLRYYTDIEHHKNFVDDFVTIIYVSLHFALQAIFVFTINNMFS